MFTATPATELEIPVLSSQTCPSLTGQSKLTYHLGLVGADLHLRINANTGGGFFSKEWLSMARILERIPATEPFTSRVFNGLFRVRSANTPGFLLAVLRHEGLVQRSTVNRRCWERGDLDAFNAKVAALTQGAAQPQVEGRAGKRVTVVAKVPAVARPVSKAAPCAKAPPAKKR